MMTLEEIRKKLFDRRTTVVAKETGLTPNAVSTVRNRPEITPHYKTIVALSDYFSVQK
jgi:hypothetical protein